MAEHEVHVTIDNRNDTGNLTLNDEHASHGSYNPKPPSTIDGNAAQASQTSGSFILSANAGFYGAEGSCIYNTSDGGQISLSYGDPITADNYATVEASGTDLQVTWKGKAGSSDWLEGSVPKSGNPVYIQVTVSSPA